MTETRKTTSPPQTDFAKLAYPLSFVAAAFGVAWHVASWKTEAEDARKALAKDIAIIEAKISVVWTTPDQDRWVAMLRQLNPQIVVPDPR